MMLNAKFSYYEIDYCKDVHSLLLYVQNIVKKTFR